MCDVALRNIRVGSVVIQIRASMQNHMTVSLKRDLIDNARFPRLTAFVAASILLSALAPRAHAASQYIQHNLVSDVPGIADQTDPNLVNPWGISMSSTSPFWISNNHAGVAAVYDGQGQPAPAANPLRVMIPIPSGGTPPAAPTGQVFDDATGINGAG